MINKGGREAAFFTLQLKEVRINYNNHSGDQIDLDTTQTYIIVLRGWSYREGWHD